MHWPPGRVHCECRHAPPSQKTRLKARKITGVCGWAYACRARGVTYPFGSYPVDWLGCPPLLQACVGWLGLREAITNSYKSDFFCRGQELPPLGPDCHENVACWVRPGVRPLSCITSGLWFLKHSTECSRRSPRCVRVGMLPGSACYDSLGDEICFGCVYC